MKCTTFNYQENSTFPSSSSFRLSIYSRILLKLLYLMYTRERETVQGFLRCLVELTHTERTKEKEVKKKGPNGEQETFARGNVAAETSKRNPPLFFLLLYSACYCYFLFFSFSLFSFKDESAVLLRKEKEREREKSVEITLAPNVVQVP